MAQTKTGDEKMKKTVVKKSRGLKGSFKVGTKVRVIQDPDELGILGREGVVTKTAQGYYFYAVKFQTYAFPDLTSGSVEFFCDASWLEEMKTGSKKRVK